MEPVTPVEVKESNSENNHLRIHYEIVALLYVLAAVISFEIISLPESQKDIVTLLSTGAILATFGSAIGSIGLIWQNDLLERVHLNVDILFKDILKQDNPWRRWPFLSRTRKQNFFDGGCLNFALSNPRVPLNVGAHVIKVDVPTVLEDFFDLPLTRNYWMLAKFRYAAHTVYRHKTKEGKNPDTGMEPSNEHLAYECIFDTWNAIFKFRVARYIIHFGSGLTIFGTGIVASYVVL